MHESIELTEAEIRSLTHLKQPAAQARALTRLQVPYTRRLDGSLLVGRDAMRRVLGAPIERPAGAKAANGPRWSKQA